MDEWIIEVVKPMCDNAQSNVRVSSRYTKPIKVSFAIHQVSAMSPLLFINVMEALTREFRVGYPWELLYTGDIADTLEKVKRKLKKWKTGLEEKILKLKVAKTKVMCSSQMLQKRRSNVSNFLVKCVGQV